LALREKQYFYEEAFYAFRAAAKLSRYNVVPLNNQALMLKKLGRLDEAIELLEQTAAKWPRELLTACNQCMLFCDAGREQEAFAALERAEQIVDWLGEKRVHPKGLARLIAARPRVRPAQGFPVVMNDPPTA